MDILAPLLYDYSKRDYMMVLTTEVSASVEGIEPGFGYTIYKVFELPDGHEDLIKKHGKYIIGVRMTWGYDYNWRGSFRKDKTEIW